MRFFKQFIITGIFIVTIVCPAIASEPAAKPDKGKKGDSYAADPPASPLETPPTQDKKKEKQGSKKPTAEHANDVVPINTEAMVERISASSRQSTLKKKTSVRKKKKIVRAVPVEEHSAQSVHGGVSVDAEEAIKRLLEGNRRYVDGANSASHRTAKRRAEVAKGQHPFAVIVGCADSRVPPEILFDQGMGDLFVVRSAGNVVDDIAIGSIEYAVEHLGVQLIVVLGHERCGAVDATLKGGEIGGKLKSVVEAIKPAVEKAKAKKQTSHGCDLLCSSVKSNARSVVEKLRKSSPVLTESVENGMLRVVGAYYELESGVVSLTYKPVL